MPLVANTSEASTGGAGYTTPAIDTTGADFLVAVLTWYTGLGGTPTLSDSKGNTWIPLTHQAGTDHRNQIYYAVNPTVGSGHDFTIAGSNLFSALCVAAFSGRDITDPFDQENGAAGSGITSLQTGSVTPSEDDELIIAGVGLRDEFGTADTVAINSSFAITDQEPGVSSNSLSAALAYLEQGPAAAVNPSWSWTTTDKAAATIATFKAAAAGGTTAPWYHNLQMAG